MKSSHYLALVSLFLLVSVVPVQAWQLGRDNLTSRGISLVAVQQGDAILLSWRKMPKVDGYRIYHQEGAALPAGANWLDIDGSQSSYLFTDVVVGTSYTFRIATLHGRHAEIASIPVSVTIHGQEATKRSDLGK